MCRFLVYRGREVFMSDLLTRSEQSLIRQSFKAREREEPLNGDGFGVGWYAEAIDPTPGVFTSVTPAWSNRNLRRMADKIRTTCMFAHVRAASTDSAVTELNCHPFRHKQFLWMHNGWIPDFHRIRRRVRDRLSDELYNYIQGTTDSEHAFALFLHRLHKRLDDYNIDTLVRTMTGTIRKLDDWSRAAGTTEPSYFNFAVTDGHNIVASRYVSDESATPQSLYVARGERFASRGAGYNMVAAHDHVQAVIIASEPLTDDREDWEEVPRNHIVTISPELHVRLQPIR